MTTQLMRKPYPSDLTDVQWEILALLIPEPAADSLRQPIQRRELVNGIMYAACERVARGDRRPMIC